MFESITCCVSECWNSLRVKTREQEKLWWQQCDQDGEELKPAASCRRCSGLKGTHRKMKGWDGLCACGHNVKGRSSGQRLEGKEEGQRAFSEDGCSDERRKRSQGTGVADESAAAPPEGSSWYKKKHMDGLSCSYHSFLPSFRSWIAQPSKCTTLHKSAAPCRCSTC